MLETYKSGRKPQLLEGERLQIKWLHEYFESEEPSYPIDVSNHIVDWLMLGNGPDPTLTVNEGKPVGDCVPAAFEHDRMLAGVVPNANATVTMYLDYDKGQDEGVVIASFLLWLYQQGAIAGFAPVQLTQVDATMDQFNRGVILGVSLTDQNESQFPGEWTADPTDPPDPNLGHGVLKVKSQSLSGTGTVVSWGAGVECSPEWLLMCPEEAWIILTPDDKAALPATSWAALVADLDALPNATPAPEPTPAPPTPGPTPPTPTPNPPPSPSPNPPTPPEGLKAWLEGMLKWLESL